MGKYVDYYYENNRLQKLVDRIIKKSYGWIPQKDYDDLYSIAGQALWYCEQRFDEKKGKSFEKYLKDSLHRKIKTQITHMNRKKRNNGTPDLSMEKMIDDESDMTIGDVIAAKEVPDLDLLAQRYLDSLTKKQRQVAELMMQGCNDKDIKVILGMSNEQYKIVVMNMKNDKKITPLKTLKERMRWN